MDMEIVLCTMARRCFVLNISRLVGTSMQFSSTALPTGEKSRIRSTKEDCISALATHMGHLGSLENNSDSAPVGRSGHGSPATVFYLKFPSSFHSTATAENLYCGIYPPGLLQSNHKQGRKMREGCRGQGHCLYLRQLQVTLSSFTD